MTRVATMAEAKALCFKAARERFIDIAKAGNAKVLTTDPRPTIVTRYVDGVKGGTEDRVKPAGGTITYVYPRVAQVARYAMLVLQELSPVKSGEYRAGHQIFVNGQPVDKIGDDIPPDAEISISNPVPYSRKIEVGKMHMRLPGTDMVYQHALAAVKKRFGKIANVEFTYRAIIGGGQVNQMQTTAKPIVRHAKGTKIGGVKVGGRFDDNGGSQAHNVSGERYPTLVILPLGMTTILTRRV